MKYLALKVTVVFAFVCFGALTLLVQSGIVDLEPTGTETNSAHATVGILEGLLK